MIRWAFNIDDVPSGIDIPIALVLPVAFVETLPSLTRDQLGDAAASGVPGVLRRQAMAALASRALGIEPRSVRLSARPDRRRILDGTTAFASISYRSGLVAAALARVPIGIDLEAIDDAAAGRVALDGFDGDAIALIAWQGASGIWAAKEAALKAGGDDLTTAVARWRFGDAVISYNKMAPLRVQHRTIGGVVAAVAT